MRDQRFSTAENYEKYFLSFCDLTSSIPSQPTTITNPSVYSPNQLYHPTQVNRHIPSHPLTQIQGVQSQGNLLDVKIGDPKPTRLLFHCHTACCLSKHSIYCLRLTTIKSHCPARSSISRPAYGTHTQPYHAAALDPPRPLWDLNQESGGRALMRSCLTVPELPCPGLPVPVCTVCLSLEGLVGGLPVGRLVGLEGGYRDGWVARGYGCWETRHIQDGLCDVRSQLSTLVAE